MCSSGVPRCRDVLAEFRNGQEAPVKPVFGFFGSAFLAQLEKPTPLIEKMRGNESHAIFVINKNNQKPEIERLTGSRRSPQSKTM